MRVLVVANNFPTPELPLDGAYVLRQLQALRRLGHEFRVLRLAPFSPKFYPPWAYYRRIPKVYESEEIPVHVLRTIALPRLALLPTYSLQLASPVRDQVRDFGADLIHAHGTLPAGLVASSSTLPYILTGHGSDTYDTPWRRRSLELSARRAVRTAACCTAVSAFIADSLRRLGSPKVTIVPNGADDTILRPLDRNAARRAFNLSPDERIIAFVGRLDMRKGIGDLIDAVARLRDMDPLILLAGEGAAREALTRRAQAAGVRIRFLGGIAQPALAEVYGSADVFALPSHREGLPTVVCEAMLCGRVVVASRAGGIPEIVRDGETGFLHDVGDVEIIAGLLRRVLADSVLRHRLECGARAYALEHLTWSKNALAYDRIYRTVMS